jgi:hypothetical protein
LAQTGVSGKKYESHAEDGQGDHKNADGYVQDIGVAHKKRQNHHPRKYEASEELGKPF